MTPEQLTEARKIAAISAPGSGAALLVAHIDDGGTARLAVRLDLQVKFLPGCVVAIPPLAHDSPASAQHDGTDPDKLRAWREAVVRCADAVGERMQKGGA